jgi:hypothetical protein
MAATAVARILTMLLALLAIAPLSGVIAGLVGRTAGLEAEAIVTVLLLPVLAGLFGWCFGRFTRASRSTARVAWALYVPASALLAPTFGETTAVVAAVLAAIVGGVFAVAVRLARHHRLVALTDAAYTMLGSGGPAAVRSRRARA